MFKIKKIWLHVFSKINLRKFTTSSKTNFIESQLVYSQTKFSVSSGGPKLSNKLLDQQQKSLDH